jgi:hypothetical protein
MAMGICLHALMWIFSPIHLRTCILYYLPHLVGCPFVAALSPYSVTALLVALLPYSVTAPLVALLPYSVNALLLLPLFRERSAARPLLYHSNPHLLRPLQP